MLRYILIYPYPSFPNVDASAADECYWGKKKEIARRNVYIFHNVFEVYDNKNNVLCT